MPDSKPISCDGEFLKCPKCGATCLHHGLIVVHERRHGEDGDAVQTRIDGPRTEVAVVGEKSTVGRRDELHISFSCENCPALLRLYIVQHKGQTLITWGAPFA